MPEADEVLGADPLVGHQDAAGVDDGVPEGHRPGVLDDEQHAGAAVGQLVDEVLGDVLDQAEAALVGDLGAGLGTRDEALEAGRAEADERADLGAERLALLVVEVGDAQDVDLVVRRR